MLSYWSARSCPEKSLKPLLHSLLVSGTLPTLSLANNKRIRNKGWKLISLFIRKAHALRYLDLSDNLVDKKVADSLVSAVHRSARSALDGQNSEAPTLESQNGHAYPINVHKYENEKHLTRHGTERATTEEEQDDLPPHWAAPLLSRSKRPDTVCSSVSSLRMESCSLKNPTLEALAHGVRQSEIKHVSLRRNRINNMGAVALAVMIRDYEIPIRGEGERGDSIKGHEGGPPPLSQALDGTVPDKSVNYPIAHATNSVTARLEAAAQRMLPSNTISHRMSDHDIDQSTGSGSIHSNHSIFAPTSALDDTEDQDSTFGPERGRVVLAKERDALRHSEMKSRLTREIEALPRVGSLLTLDVKSNDLRVGHYSPIPYCL